MSDEPRWKDGVKRMWARFRLEAKLIRRELEKQQDSHDPYTNFWVEACRHGSYLVGHLLAWFVPVIIGLLIYGYWP